MTSDLRTQTLEKVTDHALKLASDRAWARLTLAALCAGSDVTLSDCATLAITKADVCSHLDTRHDLLMLATTPNVDHTQSVRDRLFDVLMGRFDVMETHRTAWLSIFEGERDDALAMLARQVRRVKTATWALEAAGVSASSLRGTAQAVALARVLRRCEKSWRGDNGDLAKTMASLDQDLRSAETWMERANTLGAFLRPTSPSVKPEAEQTP